MALTYYTGCKFAGDVRTRSATWGRANCYAHDIGDPETFDELRLQVLNEFGQIDILVNSAGITRDRSFKKMTTEMWNDRVTVNLTGFST